MKWRNLLSIWSESRESKFLLVNWVVAPPTGLEPVLLAPEASALSAELRGHYDYIVSDSSVDHKSIVLVSPEPFQFFLRTNCIGGLAENKLIGSYR